MDSGKVGFFIATLRKARGMTQQDLANRLNVTNKAISKWETGEGYPEITMLLPLADVLGVTVDELLMGERDDVPKTGEVEAHKSHTDTSNPGLNQAILKFQNMSLLSAGITVVGFILFFAITLSFYYELIGFGVMAVFIISSIMLFVTQYNMLIAVDLQRTTGSISGNSLIINICLWSTSLVAALPYLLLDNGVFSQSILLFRSYIQILPSFLFAESVVFYFIWQLLPDRLNIRSDMPGLLFEKSMLREGKLKLNMASCLYGLAFIIFIIAVQAFEYSVGIAVAAAVILPYALAYIIYAVVRISRIGKSQDTRMLIACALRNWLCLDCLLLGIIAGTINKNLFNGEWFFAQIKLNIVLPYINAAYGVFIVITAIIWLTEYGASKRDPNKDAYLG